MNDIVRFALLGLGAGAIYGLIAQGMVIIYRGSGVLNLGQGAMAMVGAFAFDELRRRTGLPDTVAVALATLITAVIGLFAYAVVFRRLATAPPVIRLIGSLGLFLTLEAGAALRYGSEARLTAPLLPDRPIKILGTRVGEDRLIIFAIGVLATVVLWAVYRNTQFGRVTTAVTENQLTAAVLGHSPTVSALVNWGLGSAIAGFAGALIAPITGLQVGQLSALVVPAVAAALASRFVSFPLSFAAGVLIGVAESEVGAHVSSTGWSTAVPILFIVLVLVVRGRGLPARGEDSDRLPLAMPATSRRSVTVVLVVLAAVVADTASVGWVLPITVTAVFAVIGLSVVVVTGLGGQLSLATFAFSGVGALTAAHLSSNHGWNLLESLVAGAVAAMAVGLVVGLLALRTRGISLAIVTLGVGAAVDAVVFSNGRYTGGLQGLVLGSTSVFGWNVNALAHPSRYAVFAIVVLGVLLLLVQNLRRSGTGRNLLAVRANERAATALGINVARTKLYAFGFSSFLAGIGGVLFIFQGTIFVANGQFGLFQTLTVVGLVVIGSAGFRGGAIVAAMLAAGALLTHLLDTWATLDRYIPLLGGIGILLTVLANSDGIFANLWQLGGRVRAGALLRILPGTLLRTLPGTLPGTLPRTLPRVRLRPAERPQRADGEGVARHDSALLLSVRDLSVSYGGVAALRGVSLEVAPGSIVGLIGPNGAGKTTFIDAVTGTARSTGRVALGDRQLNRMSGAARARAGLSRSFQSLELFQDMTVLENLAAGSPPRRFGWLLDLFLPRPARLTPEARNAVREFGLEDCLDQRPAELTFGRQRLVGIARALAISPSIVLLDEPGAGLDTAEIDHLSRLLRRLAQEWNIGVLLVEHHLEMVLSVCDEVVVVDAGVCIAQGTPQHIADHPAVLEAYIGRSVGPPVDDGHGAQHVPDDPSTERGHPLAPRPVEVGKPS